MARDAPAIRDETTRSARRITDARTANARQDDARIDRPNEHTDRRDRGGDGGPRDRSASGERQTTARRRATGAMSRYMGNFARPENAIKRAVRATRRRRRDAGRRPTGDGRGFGFEIRARGDDGRGEAKGRGRAKTDETSHRSDARCRRS